MVLLKIFIKASWQDKARIIAYICRSIIQRLSEYWLGSVSVIRDHIWTGPDQKELYQVSIIAGRFGRGSWLSGIGADRIPVIIEQMKSHSGRFLLHIDYGLAFNEYLFSEYLKKKLLGQLEQIIQEEKLYIERELKDGI